jgi:putative phage-type endonuclease
MEENIKELLDIISFLGHKKSDLLDINEYSSFKKNIVETYKVLNEKVINENSIDELFEVKYVLKDKYNNEHSVDSDKPHKVKLSNVKPNKIGHYLDQLDNIKKIDLDPEFNNIIDSYKQIDIDLNKIDLDQKIKIKMESIDNLKTVEYRDDTYELMINELKPHLVGDLLDRTKHFDYLRNLPQPIQKSKEWFELRDGMITASAAADILGESPYGSREEMVLDKIGLLPNKYKENMFVHHGKKYERIATMIYENLYNTKVGEFGLVPYQNNHTDKELITYMGASPDGISTCITLDGKPNKLVGRMLEIKCPLKRKITTKGEIDGTICPHYYWVQVQVQLACCKNDDCDFWQCNLQEYTDDDWQLDNTDDDKIECIATVEQDQRIPINSRLTKGCIIQLLPLDKTKVPIGDRIEWYAKYIYPNNLMMTETEYMTWAEHIRINWKTLYPEFADGYRYDKILYWKLRNCHNVLIKRDIKWFDSKVPLWKAFWQEVLVLRADKKKAQELLDKYLSKKKTRAKKEPIKPVESSYSTLSTIFVKTKKNDLLNNDDDFLTIS